MHGLQAASYSFHCPLAKSVANGRRRCVGFSKECCSVLEFDTCKATSPCGTQLPTGVLLFLPTCVIRTGAEGGNPPLKCRSQYLLIMEICECAPRNVRPCLLLRNDTLFTVHGLERQAWEWCAMAKQQNMTRPDKVTSLHVRSVSQKGFKGKHQAHDTRAVTGLTAPQS